MNETLEQMDRLIAWLEAMELEAHKEAAKHEGKAEAFRSAALKARFARQGMQSPNAELSDGKSPMSNTDSTTPPEQSAVPSAPAMGCAAPCACVASSPWECARRRDGEEWYDTKRECECSCHDPYYEDDSKFE